MYDTTEADDARTNDENTLTLRTELEGYTRVTLEGFREVRDDTDSETLCRVGNPSRYETLDHATLPEGVEERGYFENDYRGVTFALEALADPTWETVMMAASMWCGGMYDEEAFTKAVRDYTPE